MGVMISAWQRGAAESRACNECLDVAAIILMRLRRAELIADFPGLAMGFAFHAEEKMAPETGLEPVTRRLTAGCSTIELLWKPEREKVCRRTCDVNTFCDLLALVNVTAHASLIGFANRMKDKIHPKYQEAEVRCACGNTFKTRSTKPVIVLGICNVCHPFYTGQQKFVDTAGRVDKFQQRMAKTIAAQEAMAAARAAKKKRK